MPDDHQATENTGDAGSTAAETPAKKAPARKTAAKKTAAKKAPAKKATAKKAAEGVAPESAPSDGEAAATAPAKKTAARKTAAKKAPAKKAAAEKATTKSEPAATPPETATESTTGTMLLFQAPDPTQAKTRPSRSRKAAAAPAEEAPEQAKADSDESAPAPKAGTRAPRTSAKAKADSGEAKTDQQPDQHPDDDDDTDGGGARRRRRRGGRRRRKPGEGDSDSTGNDEGDDSTDEADSGADEGSGDGSTRRRRRRRRAGEDGDEGSDDPHNTVTRVRKTRSAEDQITAISGSTRLEAKKQRRRDGREAGRRRAPIVSEAEFLARREAVDRVMVIRQRDDLTQIGVLEDKVLVEHYVARESQTSLIGNVYLGRVQNVLPSMEAAFIDIGKGRNAVLYAGEVNWSSLGHKDGAPRKIESVLTSGQPVLVQVTKDPIGHKGARLTSQVSLAGRFLVYVPDGTTSGISRKLPDTERSRLKALLKEIVPDTAGVIVRTAAEGASEEELTRDVERLKARWEDIEAKVKGNAPQLLYGEPDLTLKVVRDLFTEDFTKLVIEGDDAWDTVQGYVRHVAPDLEPRLERFTRADNGKDIFATYRIDEQIAKGLDRKVWLPSGGSLIIDRTEAMTVVDVNTGKFTGSGGNLEETVTKNNLEAAEEMVRQLRLRDIGGIIVIDFIDMVLESNRDLVLRRLVECLGRDRTRHQVAEVTSLGLVQMTRKRIGTGLVESFSENCEHCQGRGVVIHDAPVEPRKTDDEGRRGGARRSRGGRGRDDSGSQGADNGSTRSTPSPKDVAAVAKPENADKAPVDLDEPVPAATPDQPKVETRSRRRSASRPAGSTTPQPEPIVVEEPEPAPEPEVAASAGQPAPPAEQPTGTPTETPAETPTETPTETGKPQVVTRSRRRSASRPAGSTTPQPEPIVVEEPEPTPEPTPEPAAGAPVAPVPDKPQVVTRTRRRSATRPAGPPSGGSVPSLDEVPAATGGVGTPAATGVVEPGTASTEPGTADASTPPAIEHVPIKKKGSRKR